MPPKFDTIHFQSVLNKIKYEAHENAYELMKLISTKQIHIATAESLTAGLIFSTLVDIPFGGWLKYGCFGVYDTDAKRTFLGVQVKDVYTLKCAKEIGCGVLKNSNASLAIAVTGNAMPGPNSERRLGEVFIGIAGYTSNNEIRVSTKVYNFCKDLDTCNLWINIPHQERELNAYIEKVKNNLIQNSSDSKVKCDNPELESVVSNYQAAQRMTDGFNDFQLTSIVAEYVRFATTKQAYIDCMDFINTQNLIVPSWISNNRIEKLDGSGTKIDKLKKMTESNNRMLIMNNINIVCVGPEPCDDKDRAYTAEIHPEK